MGLSTQPSPRSAFRPASGGGYTGAEVSSIFLITTAITTNKIIAGVVVLVVVIAGVGYWMSRRRRS